jgi:hypothetical protein
MATHTQALEYQPNYLVYKNEHANLIDNLSYVDQAIDEESKRKALLAIKEFTQTFPKTKDYLASLPLPESAMLTKEEINQIKQS